MKFEIKEDFELDGNPIKLISGAVHYFRIPPSKWLQTLHNLKAIGANTVETYIPWNLHETQEGEFNFSGLVDIEKFLQLATQMDLMIILRPSPYICAEWEFGGFPAWLLEKNIRVRSQDKGYIEAVDKYFSVLLPILAKYQTTRGGNVIMMQIENEYGSFSSDKEYLKINKRLMEKYGIDVPLFTSDGGYTYFQKPGNLVEENVLSTANFGSDAVGNFRDMQKLFDEYGKKWPLMCMEFWDGWFNSWGEKRILRDPQETAQEIKKCLELGSINLYMFHGGTSFGFMNGAIWADAYKPQVTSYDYDAPLDEQGNPTEKYYAIREAIKEMFPKKILPEPIITKGTNQLKANLSEKVSLFSTLDTLATPVENDYTMPMEKLGQWYGYILYESNDYRAQNEATYRVINANDRLQVFQGNELKATQDIEQIGQDFQLDVSSQPLRILVENRGRVNYGPKLLDESQHKGIRGGVQGNVRYLSGWKHYCLPLDNLEQVDFTQEWIEKTPAFYKFNLTIKEEEMQDYFIELGKAGKGVVFVNGINIGRFWDIGPFTTAYAPQDFWKVGDNEIVLFETEGVALEELVLKSEHTVLDFGDK